MRREGEGEDSRYFPTMKELAELHGIAYQTLRERAAKDRWTEAKQKYQIEFERQRYIARSKKLAKQAGEFDERAYTAGNMGVVLIQTRLVEITQQATRLRARREHALQQAEQGLDVDPKDLRSAIYHQELLALGSALERFQAVAMRALGTDVKKIEMAGPEGSAIEVNVHHELTRDDPERVAAVLAAIRDSGQLEDIAALLEGVESTDEDIQDAEVVEDDDEGEAGK
jgi:hypothetical protein